MNNDIQKLRESVTTSKMLLKRMLTKKISDDINVKMVIVDCKTLSESAEDVISMNEEDYTQSYMPSTFLYYTDENYIKRLFEDTIIEE